MLHSVDSLWPAKLCRQRNEGGDGVGHEVRQEGGGCVNVEAGGRPAACGEEERVCSAVNPPNVYDQSGILDGIGGVQRDDDHGEGHGFLAHDWSGMGRPGRRKS
jgi:hypothetical protein